jgi:hypothetical protein
MPPALNLTLNYNKNRWQNINNGQSWLFFLFCVFEIFHNRNSKRRMLEDKKIKTKASRNDIFYPPNTPMFLCSKRLILEGCMKTGSSTG